MINNFYFFGTSFSAGGMLYRKLDTENKHCQEWLKILTRFDKYKTIPVDYSTSYEFSKLLKLNNFNNKTIVNLAKAGYGLERIFREVTNLIFNSNFNPHESVLIIELTDNIYRRDFYYNPIEDHVVGTHKKGIDTFYIMNRFWEDKAEVINSFLKDKQKIIDYYKLTYNVDQVLKKSELDTLMFLSLLEKLKIKYVFSSGPYFVNKNKLNKINFDYNKIIIDDLEKWIISQKLDIKTETNTLVPDPYHLGIKGTKIVSNLILDKLKELNYL
jgi:hypothetical protein